MHVWSMYDYFIKYYQVNNTDLETISALYSLLPMINRAGKDPGITKVYMKLFDRFFKSIWLFT